MSLEPTTKGSYSEYSFEPIGQSQLKPTYSVELKKEGDGFVITCPELSATTQGDTEKDAIKNMLEAIELVLETESKPNDFNIYVRKT